MNFGEHQFDKNVVDYHVCYDDQNENDVDNFDGE